MKKSVVYLFGNRPLPLPMNFVRALETRGGHSVELLYYDRGDRNESMPTSDRLRLLNSTAIKWPVGSSRIKKVINRLIVLGMFVRRLRAMKPDVIQASNFDMLLAARIATLGRPRTKIVFILQDTTPWMVQARFRWFQRCLYRATDLIFVSSLGFRDQFLQKFRLVEASKPVLFVPNVTLDERFRDFVPRDAEESLTIGCVGLLRGEEGLRALVDAAARARKAGADVRVLFAGKGPMESYVKHCQKNLKFVNYLGSYRHEEEIREIYGKVDLLYGVYDRSYDKKIHLAYRFCEAVNCRMPIIVAEGTHMCAEAQRYGVGLCVPLGDVGRLAEELVKLCESKETRAKIAENCDKARSEFVFEHYEERICQAYQELWEA